MKLAAKTKRLLAYVGILGGCAILALTFFTISQWEKAKYKASISSQLVLQNKVDELLAYDKNAIEDETSKYHDAAVYWNDMLIDFTNITKTNSAAYMGTAIPAYAMSMATLISFGLILKHAEKAKEAEDQNI